MNNIEKEYLKKIESISEYGHEGLIKCNLKRLFYETGKMVDIESYRIGYNDHVNHSINNSNYGPRCWDDGNFY